MTEYRKGRIDNGRGNIKRIPNSERKSDKSPHFRGALRTPDGQMLFVSGWHYAQGTSRSGDILPEMISFAVEYPPERREDSSQRQETRGPGHAYRQRDEPPRQQSFEDDDSPFDHSDL